MYYYAVMNSKTGETIDLGDWDKKVSKQEMIKKLTGKYSYPVSVELYEEVDFGGRILFVKNNVILDPPEERL